LFSSFVYNFDSIENQLQPPEIGDLEEKAPLGLQKPVSRKILPFIPDNPFI